MKKYLSIILCSLQLFVSYNGLSQNNLIFDGDFEFIPCPTDASCTNNVPDFNPSLCCYIPCTKNNFANYITSRWYVNNTFNINGRGPSMLDRRWQQYSYSSSCNGNLGMPYNVFGTQEHRGGANAGIRYVALENNLVSSDGIAAELTQELVKGRDYRLKFYAVKKGGANKDHKIQIQFRF